MTLKVWLTDKFTNRPIVIINGERQMKFWNKKLKKMREYIPGEQPSDIDTYIKLNTNENPFSPSQDVLDATAKACNMNIKRYPEPTAISVRKIFAEQNDLKIENIFIGNGSDEVFTLIFRSFIESNETVAFPYPSYSLYDILAEANGVKFEKIPLNDDFTLNLDSYLNKNFKMVIIANPNNPTGGYIEVSKIKSFLDSYDGLLIVDEAYIDFYGGSAIDLVKSYDNIIVTRSFSKSYSLAGLRIGIAIAHEDIIRGFMKIKDSYNLDTIAASAAKAALLDKKNFNYNLEMLKNNKEYLEERLSVLDFNIVPSRGNFLFLNHPKINSKELYEQLKKRKILIRHFNGKVQEDYVRITVGTMMEIKNLIIALTSILEEL